MPESDHYILISADAHAGADIWDYKPYLESKWHDDFDEWAKQSMEAGSRDDARDDEVARDEEGRSVSTAIPIADADRNWNSDRRLREQEADGWVAEVIFPNTQPPFAPLPASEFEAPQTGDDVRAPVRRASARTTGGSPTTCRRRRSVAPGARRSSSATSRARSRRSSGRPSTTCAAASCCPGAPPGSGVPPLYAPDYEPIWSACEANEMPVNHHSGGGTPDFGLYPPASMAMFMLEVTWWAHRRALAPDVQRACSSAIRTCTS